MSNTEHYDNDFIGTEYCNDENDEVDVAGKIHDILRTMQWLIPALVTFFGVLDKAFGWGVFGTVEMIASGLVALIGVIAQHSSHDYFSTKTIMNKILPDKEPEEVEE